MKKTLKWICNLLIATIYVITLIMAFIVNIVDQGEIDRLHGENPVHGMYEIQGWCQMPGCDKVAEVRLFKSVQTQYKRHANLNLENKANFTIETGTCDYYETDTYTEKEKYLLIQAQGNGSYHASIEEREEKHSITGDKHTHYYTAASGYYCTEHNQEARSIILTEFETALRSTFAYQWGSVLFPVNLVIITCLLCLIAGLRKGNDQGAIPLIMLIATAIFSIFTWLATKIGDDVLRGGVYFGMLLMATAAGAALTYTLGNNIRYRINQKRPQRRRFM